jgi:hypothetical protein
MPTVSTDRFHLFGWASIACLTVSLAFAIIQMNLAIPDFAAGPRDVPGLEGWWNIALGVGGHAFALGLLQTIPPWLILFVLAAGVRWIFRRDFLQDRTTRTNYLCVVFGVYLILGFVDLMYFWSIRRGDPLAPATVIFLPGVLVAILWLSQDVLTRVQRAFGMNR